MFKHFLTHSITFALSIFVISNYVDHAHGKYPTEATGEDQDTPLFAMVNGEPIYQSTVDFILNSQLSFVSEYDQQKPDRSSLVEGITKDLLISTLLSQEARKRGIDKDPMSQIELELSKQNLLSQLLVKQVQAELNVDEEKVKASYDAMPDPADYRLRIWTADNLKDAQSLQSSLQVPVFLDQTLPDLVEQSSPKETIWWRSVDLDPALNHALINIKVGEFASEPIPDESGNWRVVQLIEKNQYEKMPYEQEREIILAEFKQYAVNELIARLATKTPIKLYGKGGLRDDWYE